MTAAQTCSSACFIWGFSDLKETTAEYKVARRDEADFIDQKESSFIITGERIVIGFENRRQPRRRGRATETIDAAFVCDLRLAAISELQRLRLGYEPTMSADSQFRAGAQGLQDPPAEIVND